jgi:hypothetical protein
MIINIAVGDIDVPPNIAPLKAYANKSY